MKRLGKVKIIWSPDFAYAIGLIATDGNLSIDKRHINLTSKDIENIENFARCLNLSNKIGRKARGRSQDKKYYVLQFGDRNFYDFLMTIGLTPNKSKSIGRLLVPKEFFADFLRGCLDGDGNISAVKHPESKHLQLRLRLCSASKEFLGWIDEEIRDNVRIKGGWYYDTNKKSVITLCYGKADSKLILSYIYYPEVRSYLKRKFDQARPFMGEWRNWHTRSA